ncbi:hypothetical protein TOK_0987 [Pseudonocardia sp. N23]|nr:hypothetical protein TOK_0987 [Pseudonocardia sp. N23]
MVGPAHLVRLGRPHELVAAPALHRPADLLEQQDQPRREPPVLRPVARLERVGRAVVLEAQLARDGPPADLQERHPQHPGRTRPRTDPRVEGAGPVVGQDRGPGLALPSARLDREEPFDGRAEIAGPVVRDVAHLPECLQLATVALQLADPAGLPPRDVGVERHVARHVGGPLHDRGPDMGAVPLDGPAGRLGHRHREMAELDAATRRHDVVEQDEVGVHIGGDGAEHEAVPVRRPAHDPVGTLGEGQDGDELVAAPHGDDAAGARTEGVPPGGEPAGPVERGRADAVDEGVPFGGEVGGDDGMAVYCGHAGSSVVGERHPGEAGADEGRRGRGIRDSRHTDVTRKGKP